MASAQLASRVLFSCWGVLRDYAFTTTNRRSCDVSVMSCNGVHPISEDSSILECDTSLGQQFPTFRRIVVISSSAARSLRRVSLMCHHHHQVTSRILSRTWRYSDLHAILLRFRQVQGGRWILKMTACFSETSPINQTTRPQSGLSPSRFIQCGFQMSQSPDFSFSGLLRCLYFISQQSVAVSCYRSVFNGARTRTIE